MKSKKEIYTQKFLDLIDEHQSEGRILASLNTYNHILFSLAAFERPEEHRRLLRGETRESILESANLIIDNIQLPNEEKKLLHEIVEWTEETLDKTNGFEVVHELIQKIDDKLLKVLQSGKPQFSSETEKFAQKITDEFSEINYSIKADQSIDLES